MEKVQSYDVVVVGGGAAGTCFSGVGVPQKSAPMRLRLCSVIERITSSCRRMISSFLL